MVQRCAVPILFRAGAADIDVLVSNVAVSPHFGAFFDTDDAAWDKLFEINIKAAFFLTKVHAPVPRSLT